MKTLAEATDADGETDDRFDSGRIGESRTAPPQPENAKEQVKQKFMRVDHAGECLLGPRGRVLAWTVCMCALYVRVVFLCLCLCLSVSVCVCACVSSACVKLQTRDLGKVFPYSNAHIHKHESC